MNECLGTIWVCVDCMLTHANGECGENPDREPLGLLAEYEITMGLLREEHHEDCDSDECDCEVISFSAVGCDGCGSPLHGERHAMAIWSRA